MSGTVRPFELRPERLPPADVLRQVLDLRAGGRLYWRPRGPEWFPGKRSWTYKLWNAGNAGNEAFTAIKSGYYSGTLFGRYVKAHRVVFKMVFGYEPIQVDHIDGDTLNNRPENLRPADAVVNHRNVRRRRDNKSGITGVVWAKGKRKWRAEICVRGRNHFIGYYDTIGQAARARKGAATMAGFTGRHGE